jgi:hypothetical protein
MPEETLLSVNSRKGFIILIVGAILLVSTIFLIGKQDPSNAPQNIKSQLSQSSSSQ